MTIQVSDPHYINAAHTHYDVVADWGEGPHPYTVAPDDPAPVAVAIRDYVAANSVAIAAYVAPPPPVPPVPSNVTRRQMLIGLQRAGFITANEMKLAAKTGTLPAAVQTVFNQLPTQTERDEAEATWASMSQCERSSPLVAALAASQGLTSSQVDDLFQAWALI
jgi:hypothetical protein